MYQEIEKNILEKVVSLDQEYWLQRWDEAQNAEVPSRIFRFQLMARLAKSWSGKMHKALDICCGTGSLTDVLITALPSLKVDCVDTDPCLLTFAKHKFKGQKNIRLINADLRFGNWTDSLKKPYDVVMSSIALHWFNRKRLKQIYCEIYELLRPGGLFVNSDMVSPDNREAVEIYKQESERVLKESGSPGNSMWISFWQDLSKALDIDLFDYMEKKFRNDPLPDEYNFPYQNHVKAL